MSDIKPIDFSALPQGLNTPTDQIIRNVETNIRRHLPQLRTYQPQPRTLCIVAGGPSLDDTWYELESELNAGAAVLSVNGTYNHLVKRGVTPSLFCMLDARAWNTRFLSDPQPTTKYFLASQCDPSAFDAVAEHDTFIWHAPIPCPKGETAKSWNEGRKLFRDYYLRDRNFLLVPGGVTVTAKSVMLSYWLGFRNIHMFGFDSCWMDDRHHAYSQPENRDKNVRFKLGDRWFNCAPWMAHQADSFFKLVVNLPDDLNLQVHGDGLIAYGISRSAEEWERLHAA